MAAVDQDRGEGSCIPSATNTPKALTSTSTLCRKVELVAQHADRTANAATVYVGFSSTNDTQLRPLVPGGTLVFEEPAGTGKQIDLSLIYVDAGTLNDGVTFTYLN
jgi:hypothetical protein